GKKKPTERKLYCLENTVGDLDELIGALEAEGKKWFVTLRLHNKPLRCQLDSGATCNVMSYKDKIKLAPNTPLRSSNTKLKLYSGEILSSMGIFDTDCVVRGKKYHLSFEIVKRTQSPLLSGCTCEHLGLMLFTIPDDIRTIEHLQSATVTREELLRRFSDIFNSPVESVPGDVHFELDPSVTPVQCAPRNVPIAMKADVKAQLDEYQADGHIADVTEPTDWISNMVIVKKQAKHAFLQCRLDDESSLMTTFWTPCGRKRWLKLPFGDSVAPEVYQRKQHKLLAGLKGVEPIADDILVVGCGDTDKDAESDHDTKLLALMERCRGPDPEKVRAIVNMPNPTDAKGVQRLIGFANYLAKFMPHLSAVSEPLLSLLDKDTPWHWLPKHEAAVSELKTLAASTPVLRYYDVT
ncbi:hypothetical protein NFI96_011364, partial [Prochilodus magdalenae]